MKGGQSFYSQSKPRNKGVKELKKHLALLLALVLVLGLAVPAYAAATPAKVGIVKTFTDKTITIGVDGKVATYSYDAKTKVLLNDSAAKFADAVNKGTTVKFKVSGKKATELNFTEIGDQYKGTFTVANGEVAITLTREMTTDTNNDYSSSKTSTATKEEIGKETDTAFVVRDDKTVDIGAVALVDNSLKVVDGDKELKVLTDAKAEFDKTVEGDEVKITIDTEDENQVVLNFEKAYKADGLKVSYEKKIYKVVIADNFKFPLDKNAVIDVNGKEVKLQTAINNSTYAYFILSPDNKIIYMNSFYQNLSCKVDAIKGNTISISAAPEGKAAFKDTLTLSSALSINGGALTLKDLKAGDNIELTVDPFGAFQVVSITK